MNHNVLIIGGGGREHTFAWKLSQSKQINKLYIAPGNGGSHQFAENVPLTTTDFDSIKNFVITNQISMVVVGPEDPLVNGLGDYFKSNSDLQQVIFVGPVAAGAKLEGSKVWSKHFMEKYNIPTAACKTFNNNQISDAHVFLEALNPPYVIKADGLAAGKGVIICPDLQSAKDGVNEMLSGKFGEASKNIVIEEFLSGIEVSVFVLTDGNGYVILPEAKDYKRIGNNDTGLNTGGMGAVSPVYFANTSFMEKVKSRIIEPTIAGLNNENIQYKGFIFIGLMNVNGEPYVIEYNVRMGDPETEAVIPRINNDLIELFEAMHYGNLHEVKMDINPKTAVTVVLASEGYPETFQKGKPIRIDYNGDSLIFHAGTLKTDQGIISNGGRVMAVTSLANCIDCAAKKSYETIEKIHFENKYCRTDIGNDLKNA